jgi:hypothetical protein
MTTPGGPARWTHTEIAPSEFPVPADGYEDLELGPEADAPPASGAPSRTGLTATRGPAAVRPQSESSLAAARMASAPTFKAANTGGGIPVLPIGIGVVIILAITAFAFTRGRPVAPTIITPPADPRATAIGGPPASATPPVAEPEPAQPVAAIDPLADRASAPRERPRVAEREPPARPGSGAPPPARAVTRTEKVAAAAAAARAAPAPAPAPMADPEPPPPPQFVAAPTPAPPAASAPLAVGPGSVREGYQKARQATPGCVVNTLRLPRDIVDVAGETATVKFAVDETGQVSQFSYLSGPSDQRVASAIWAAVQRCEWIPGSTAQGHRLTLWVTMPIRFGK